MTDTTSQQNFYGNFLAYTKAQWLAKIEQDLKGRTPDELAWQLDADLRISPFAHADDFPADNVSPVSHKTDNAWQISETFFLEKDLEKQTNKQVLEALMGGCTALVFRAEKFPTAAQLAVLLEDVIAAYVAIHFCATQATSAEAALFLQNFEAWAESQGGEKSPLKGSVSFDFDAENWKSLVLGVSKNHDHFRVLNIDCRAYFKNSENTVHELSLIIQRAEKLMAQFENDAVMCAQVARNLCFQCSVGVSYFVEMAKIRALRLLWANILAAYKLDPNAFPVQIFAFIEENTQDADENTHKIRQSAQAMSAVLGGADLLDISPSDAFQHAPSSSLNKRMARNTQHILQLESYLDRASDPALGSYYIETLTEKLAEAAWEKFKNKV
jgi:methylmalonyl-CoA mutase